MARSSALPVGVLAITTTVPEQIAELACTVEDLGFAEFWTAEDYFFYGGISSAAIALAATSDIRVGLGLVSAVARHPAVTAMEFGTVARAFPGRFVPTIGVGLPVWLDQMGLRPKSAMRAVRECVTSVRALLSGERLTQTGEYFTFNDVALTHPPEEEVPIHVGVIGPNLLRLSGEVADGSLISVLAGTEYLHWARERIAEGRAKAGRSGHHAMPVFALMSIDADSAKAKATLKPILAFYLTAIGPCALTDVLPGASEQLAGLIEAGGVDSVLADMPESWLEDLVVAGDPEECAAKIRALLDAGADSVILSPLPPEQAPEMLTFTAKEVLPRL